MYLRFNPYIAFFIVILLSQLTSYFFNSGIIAYGPVVFFGLLVLINELLTASKYKKKYLTVSFLWIPYIIWAGSIYIGNPIEGSYFSSYLLSVFILPLITITFYRLLKHGSNVNYYLIYKLLFIFLLLELIICIGQISTYTFGFGFPINDAYSNRGMVTGSFYNSNNLSAIILIIAFYVLGLEKLFFAKDRYLFWVLVVILLFITGSRSAILLTAILFIISKSNSPKKILIYLFIGFIVSSLIFISINYLSGDVISRIFKRMESLMMILQNGVTNDSSISARLGSYIHFITQLPVLSFGSGELKNYYIYSHGANFKYVDLLFSEPHSLVVEIGYWVGWPGLILFFIPTLILLRVSQRKIQYVIVFFIASMIPSSVIGSPVFYLLLFLIMFDYKSNNKAYIYS